MPRYVKITFPQGKILIELLQTPVVDKWLSVFNAYKELNIPSVVRSHDICGYGIPWRKKHEFDNDRIAIRIDAVKEINNAIDKVNSVIEGTKFPYKAYNGMPWMQTNRIHRCFTTSSFTTHCWQHNLTHEQLIKCKTIASAEVRNFIYNNATPQFKVHDYEIFHRQIKVINAQIHFYENTKHSMIAEVARKDYIEKFGNISSFKKNIMWDEKIRYDEDEICVQPEFIKPKYLLEITHEELLSSFPDNYEDYNVSIHKSIGGKDYETCFEQYDDSLEADIRNIEGINGCMTIYPDNEHYKFFTNTQFYTWVKNNGLRDELFLNVPIGKIVENTIIDINSLGISDTYERRNICSSGNIVSSVELL